MGSSYSWARKKSLAPNLVPVELSLKIEEKIAAGKDFHAYILVPVFPEGQVGDYVRGIALLAKIDMRND